MTVIIRLQNLPWTANARDIRNFFKGLSIPEGGVHIIGGEMGDAFIAFSTDEDARCAMLKDREKLMEIQVRLLLSSRAEMQKVIETARTMGAATPATAAVAAAATVALGKPETAVIMPPVPQPPIIGSFLLSQQQQALLTQPQIVPAVLASTKLPTPSFLAYQKQAGLTLADVADVKVERRSPERANNFSLRHRLSRSRSRSSSSDRSDHSRERERGRKRRAELRGDSGERELKAKAQPLPVTNLLPWAVGAGLVPATVAAAANVLPAVNLQQQMNIITGLPPVLQSYNTSNSTTNNYNLNLTAATQQQQQLQQQQQQQQQQLLLSSNSNQIGAAAALGVAQQNSNQEPIAFASVNPYAQMYPQLFQQQQQLLLQQATKATGSGSPGAAAANVAAGSSASSAAPVAETCYIKISGLCPTTSYSDLRKYFSGLYIPHNGIKIDSNASGTRTGVAYIEFSRVSSAQKALARNNTMYRDRLVEIVPIGDDEFEQADERFQRGSQHNSNNGGGNGSRDVGRGGHRSSAAVVSAAAAPTTVLYVEDLPQMTTEQDIMKMFSATCTIVDILLAPSPSNRRECIAFILFARENEARSALEDCSTHYIGFRKLRVRASSLAEMQVAKDKLRRASEQLQKEEQQQREDAEREQLNAQKKLQEQQNEELMIMNNFNNDPRRRNNNDMQQQQQQSIHNNDNNIDHNDNNNYNNNNNSPFQPFANTGMHNGNMPFAYQQQQQQQQQLQQNSVNHNGMHMNNNNNNNNNNNSNNNMSMPFGMPHNNNQFMQQQQQQHHQGNQRRKEDVFIRVHNCEYATRINDLGELFVSENLRIEHIEMLFNERNQSAGEFIVEFVDATDAKVAMREFHNRRFRGRGLRVSPITPQEIADRLNKPFMNYLPGGNGPRRSEDVGSPNMQQQQQQQQQQQPPQQQSSRRRGPSRFNDVASNRGGNQQQKVQPPSSNDGDSDNSNSKHFNPFAVRSGPEPNLDHALPSSPMQLPNNNNNSGSDCAPDDDGIPDKFNRPGCVVAMRNVPFKADLKDILRFFNDFQLSPNDIIRRFNDEGKPTGDARVAFDSQAEARSAFESRRRKQIFNRTVYLDII